MNCKQNTKSGGVLRYTISFGVMGIAIMGFWFLLPFQFPNRDFNFLLWIAGCLSGIGIGISLIPQK